jgi:hypothetical protein
MKRCSICDYTFEEGSELTDRAPFTGLLHDRHGEFLCDQCSDEVDNNLEDLGLNDEEDE